MRDKPYALTGCANLPCQCGKCGRYRIDCCYTKPVRCPNDRYYDPGYVCPDFTPKKEE